MATFVLVHGGFFGGWCWDAVAERLRAANHCVYTPTLPGMAERQAELSSGVDLDRHIAWVIDTIDSAGDQIILVAHSYGGMPVAGAADQRADAISTLVLLDAYAPRDGQSALDVRDAGVEGKSPLVLPDHDGVAVPSPGARAYGVEGALGEIASSRMTPQPLASITQPIRLKGNARRIARKYYFRAWLFAAPFLDGAYERCSDDLDWQTAAYAVPHCCMITHPDWLAGRLNMLEPGD